MLAKIQRFVNIQNPPVKIGPIKQKTPFCKGVIPKRRIFCPPRGEKAGGGGFEPPHTESESAVLPLDEPPACALFYHVSVC